MQLRKFRVWFTVNWGWSEEDYLDVEAMTAEHAWRRVMKANRDLHGFEIQGIEPLD